MQSEIVLKSFSVYLMYTQTYKKLLKLINSHRQQVFKCNIILLLNKDTAYVHHCC